MNCARDKMKSNLFRSRSPESHEALLDQNVCDPGKNMRVFLS